jgi:hypothetical protein
MDGPTFRTNRKWLGPAWLTQGESELVGYSVDVLKDTFAERLREGLLARFPQQDAAGTPGSDDALAAIGRDRRIVRGINESSTAYAARLPKWLDDWKFAGNPFALLKKLAEYCPAGMSFRTVDARGNWFSRAADGTQTVLLKQYNWDWDGSIATTNTPFVAGQLKRTWSRFWVIIYPNGYWASVRNWGDPGAKWGDPGVAWGANILPEQAATLRGIVSDWKPGGTRCVNIILAFDNASFDPTHARDGSGLPDGNWLYWSKTVGGARVPARLSTARYMDGV